MSQATGRVRIRLGLVSTDTAHDETVTPCELYDRKRVSGSSFLVGLLQTAHSWAMSRVLIYTRVSNFKSVSLSGLGRSFMLGSCLVALL